MIFAVIILSGCDNPENPNKLNESMIIPDIGSDYCTEAIDYERLWDVDIEQNEYIKESASYRVVWDSNDKKVSFSVAPIEDSNTTYEDIETYEKDGINYYIRESSICWDSYDLKEGGVKHFREVYCIRGNKRYSFAVEVDNDKSLLLPIETCIGILNDPESMPDGMEKSSEVWHVEFKKGSISFDATIYVAPFDTKIYNDVSNIEGLELVSDNATVYYYKSNERSVDEPNSAFVYWLSDIGLIEIRAGVPYSERNDVPNDALDFINIELAKKIVSQITD